MNISLPFVRKRSIEIARVYDRGPGTGVKGGSHFTDSRESKEAHVSRCSHTNRPGTCPRSSVLSFFTAWHPCSFNFLLFRRPWMLLFLSIACDISFTSSPRTVENINVDLLNQQHSLHRTRAPLFSHTRNRLLSLLLFLSLCTRCHSRPCTLQRISFKMQ